MNPFTPAYLRKIMDWPRAEAAAAAAREQGKKVVFTNGCFDLIHTGHTRNLAQAASFGDFLVVGLNSDKSVKRYKSPDRPIRSQDQRAEVLAALEFIDLVVIFDQDDPAQLIRVVRPDVLVKGGDWPVDQIIGADFVFANGGQVYSLPLVPGESTTGIIKKIKNG